MEDSGLNITRLFPLPSEKTGGSGIYSEISFPTNEGTYDPEIPYVVINAISTLDGKVSQNGKSSGIGSEVDRLVMRTIRSKCDAILIGAGSARAENVSLSIPDHLSDQRVRQGKSAQPLGVILSNSGVISAGLSDILVLNESVLKKKGWSSAEENIKIKDYLRFLKSEYKIETLLVEGGPTVNHSFFEEGIVNELFLTLSPKILGGEEFNLLKGAKVTALPPRLSLISTYLHESETFTRYTLSFR